MGMFDKPKYLTGGDEPFVSPGDTFYLHAAKIDGTINSGQSNEREQAKLRVSHSREEKPEDVFTGSVGIVNQVRRMDEDDRRGMPMEVRLDQVPSGKGNPTFVLTPASAPAPALGVTDF